MEQADLLLKERKTASVLNKGALLAEWSQKANFTPMRKRLSDVTNLCTNVAAERLVLGFEGNGNDESRMIAEGYIAKILKENNALKRALVERNKVIETTDAELKKLRLMLTKTNQQNWQIAQSHSNMLAELNLAKNRLISAEHELACSSAALRIKTLEVEEQKKFSKLNKPQHKISAKEGCSKPIETVTKASTVSLHKTCPSNRKHTQRNPSIDMTNDKDEIRRKLLRRKSVSIQVETSERSEVLFEQEDAKFLMCSKVFTQLKHENSSPTTQNFHTSTNEVKVSKEELSESSPYQTDKIRRTSLGRPMRKAVEKVISYKELPLKIKLRRLE